MKFEDMTSHDFIMLIAVIGLVAGFIASIFLGQENNATMTGAALAGAISLKGIAK